MMTQTTRTSLRDNQVGLVSIVVTMVLMLVISLMVLSFARTVRRDQRQQTDRQLSSRAYYAAESGVNIAVNRINTGPAVTDTKDCSADFTAAELQLDPQTEITCLSVNQDLTNLTYTALDNSPKRVLLEEGSGDTYGSFTFSWQSSTETNTTFSCVSGSNFPTGSGVGAWNCNAPVLRLDLVPIPDAGSDRQNLQDRTFTAFLYPTNNGVTNVNFSGAAGANFGSIVYTRCTGATTPYHCSLTVNNDVFGGSKYMARIISLYKTANVTVEGKVVTTGATATFKGAQASIDVTARAADVLRRIQVRKSLDTTNTSEPDSAITSASGVCKRYSIMPPASVTTDVPSDPACQPN